MAWARSGQGATWFQPSLKPKGQEEELFGLVEPMLSCSGCTGQGTPGPPPCRMLALWLGMVLLDVVAEQSFGFCWFCAGFNVLSEVVM